MNKLFSLGKGKRTYLSAIAMIVWAVYGMTTGLIDVTMGSLIIIEGFAVFGLRQALPK